MYQREVYLGSPSLCLEPTLTNELFLCLPSSALLRYSRPPVNAINLPEELLLFSFEIACSISVLLYLSFQRPFTAHDVGWGKYAAQEYLSLCGAQAVKEFPGLGFLAASPISSVFIKVYRVPQSL